MRPRETRMTDGGIIFPIQRMDGTDEEEESKRVVSSFWWDWDDEVGGVAACAGIWCRGREL